MDRKNWRITEEVVGCDFREVELLVTDTSFDVTSPEMGKKHFEFRIFNPLHIDGDLGILECVGQRLERRFLHGDRQDRDYAFWQMAMLFIYCAKEKIDPTLNRKFDIEYLCQNETFRSLRDHFLPEKTKPVEIIKRLAGETTCSTAELLASAISPAIDISIPSSWSDYEDFRNGLLNEILATQPEAEATIKKFAANRRERLGSDKSLSDEERIYRLRWLKEVEDIGFGMSLPKLMHDAFKEEKKFADRFADIVMNVRRYLDGLIQTIEAAGISIVRDPNIVLSRKYRTIINKNFDLKTANDLLNTTLERYQTEFNILRDGVIQETGDNTAISEQFAFLRQARLTDDVLIKYTALVWIVTELSNRNDYIRLVLREAEDVVYDLLQDVYYMVYLKIRQHLTCAERRFYKLMYFRTPVTSGRIFVHTPAIQSFVTGIDQETEAMTLLVLGYKITHIDGINLTQELERRWRAYLRLYPYWVETTRDDERLKKQRQWFEPKKVQHDQNHINLSFQPDHLLVYIVKVSPEQLIDWVETECPGVDGRRLLARFLDERSEADIAESEGVSQQAINRSLHRAVRGVKELLRKKEYTWNGKSVVKWVFDFHTNQRVR